MHELDTDTQTGYEGSQDWLTATLQAKISKKIDTLFEELKKSDFDDINQLYDEIHMTGIYYINTFQSGNNLNSLITSISVDNQSLGIVRIFDEELTNFQNRLSNNKSLSSEVRTQILLNAVRELMDIYSLQVLKSFFNK